MSTSTTTEVKLPPPEPREAILTRRYVILLFALTLGLVGIPLWYYTTLIYRAPLAYDKMDYYDQHMKNDFHIETLVHLNIGDEFPDIVPATQLVVDRRLDERLGDRKGWRLKMAKGCVPNEYCVNLYVADDNTYAVSEYGRNIFISYTENTLASNQLPEFIAETLLDNVFDQEIDLFKGVDDETSKKVIAYSPKYHLTFSLFSQGGSPVSWEIADALESYFIPFKDELMRVANFTIDTQVQFYSTLSVEPKQADGEFVLTQDDLSTFVNFAEWSLSSIHSYPTLNFILFIPSPANSPLVIQGSQTNSFLIPQWGGVSILNTDVTKTAHLTKEQLLPVLETFTSQLLSLLGAPTLPKSPIIRIDSLSRVSTLRALLAASSSLGSLHRLSKSLPDIAIPKSVLASVDASLGAISQSLAALKSGNWMTSEAITSAGVAMTQAHNAFFEKMMVQQAFFPEEHKVAVYLPLLGPVCVMILLGLMRFKKELKN